MKGVWPRIIAMILIIATAFGDCEGGTQALNSSEILKIEEWGEKSLLSASLSVYGTKLLHW